MPRPLLSLLSACLGMLATQASADPVFDYSLRAGHSTNLFEGTSKLSGSFIEAEGKLRGTIDADGNQLAYGIWVREKRLSKYDFGNEHAAGVSLGHKTKLADKVDFAVEGSASRTSFGKVLIAVPDAVIGYRESDWNYALASSLGAEFLGGKNTLTGSVSKVSRGTARFTTDLLLPSKVKADVTSLDVNATHIRPALSGELGFTLAYRSTFIPSSEQMELSRFPASTLRGSIAYGRKIGETLTIIAELGAGGIMAKELGSDVKRLRPYLRAAAEWKPLDPLTLGVGYDRDFTIADPDDPLGEYVGTWKFAAGLRLAPKVNATVAYEIASSEWLYYLYNTDTRRLIGTLSFDIGEKHKLELEYRRIDRREKDTAENFSGNQYLARMSGSF